jgi:large subunit ribosomal protein L17
LAKKEIWPPDDELLEFLMDETVVKDYLISIGPKYADRQGGYTRIIKKGFRRGDAAEMVLVELID